MVKENIKQYKNVKQLKSTSARKNAITLGKMFYNGLGISVRKAQPYGYTDCCGF